MDTLEVATALPVALVVAAALAATLALAAVGFLAYRSGRVWSDAGRYGFGPLTRLGWSLLAALVPNHYWWGARIEALPADEKDALLARETTALGLCRADSLRCPLCGAEVPHAWTLAVGDQPAVAPGPIECPACDFRLDACRHCEHFLPGPPRSWASHPWDGDDITFGRCQYYRTSQPVEQACAPDVARQMIARGYDRTRAPRPIQDSFLPPDSCTAFAPEPRRLRAGGVRWPGARRGALLRLLGPARAPGEPPAEPIASGEERWLL
jgi:hypothetical protein